MKWRLEERGKWCSETIVKSHRRSLDDCKTYCHKNGATRLTHYSNSNYCRCCTASSELKAATNKYPSLYIRKGKYSVYKYIPFQKRYFL